MGVAGNSFVVRRSHHVRVALNKKLMSKTWRKGEEKGQMNRVHLVMSVGMAGMLGSDTLPSGVEDDLNLEGLIVPRGTRQQTANEEETGDTSDTIPQPTPQATVDIAKLERVMPMFQSSEFRGDKVRLARMPQPSSERSLPDAKAWEHCHDVRLRSQAGAQRRGR